MKFAIDLTKVQDIKPIPTGVYVVRILDVDATKKSKAGNEKMVVKTEILAPTAVAATQKNWWFSLSLVESALFRLKQLMEAAGIPLKPGGFDTADLIGKEVGAVVNLEETKEYGIRNQVSQFIPAKAAKPEVKTTAA